VTSIAHPSARGVVPRHVAVTALLAALAVLAQLPVGFQPLPARTQLVYCAATVVLLCFASLSLVLHVPGGEHGIAHWRVGPWYLLWGGIAFGLAALTWLEPQTGTATRIALPSVVTALQLYASSVAAWTIGYLAGPPGVAVAATRRVGATLMRGTTTTIAGPAMPWLLYAFGTAGRLATVVFTGHFGYLGDPSALVSRASAYGQVLNIVSMFTVFAIAAAAYRAFTTSARSDKVTLWILAGAEIAAGALSGTKEAFVLAALAVLIPYGATRGRVSWRILVIGALVFLTMVVPFNIAYRQMARDGHNSLTPSAAMASAPQVLSTVAQPSTWGPALQDSSVRTLNRVREIDSLAIISQLSPSVIPYRSPIEFAEAPIVGLVPRALWPNKPILATGYDFSQQYYGLPSTMYTSTAVTPVGDLYRHGGWVVLVIGAVLLGVACRLFDRVLRPELDPRAVCFVLAFLPQLVKAEIDIYSLVTAIPSGIVAATLGARLICRPARSLVKKG
jgi:hypothetical protein